MATISISGPAQADLLGIREYMLATNPTAADHYRVLLRHALDHLSRLPRSGRNREDLPRPSLRSWSVWPYVILYRFDGTTVDVVRVIHGARDLPNLD